MNLATRIHTFARIIKTCTHFKVRMAKIYTVGGNPQMYAVVNEEKHGSYVKCINKCMH